MRGQIDFNWLDRNSTLSVAILNGRICEDIRENIFVYVKCIYLTRNVHKHTYIYLIFDEAFVNNFVLLYIQYMHLRTELYMFSYYLLKFPSKSIQ